MRRLALALSLLVAGDARAAWPPPANDAGFDYSDPVNWPNDPDYASAWNYWSFVPSSLAAQVDDVTRRLGTGAHIDRAWARTTGDPRVLIAVTDSGIEWNDDEVVNRLFLNARELPAPACAGNPPGRYDANGDGRFNVQDYTTAVGHALPMFSMVCDARITRDVNRNGLLDPEDLIVAFSDGKDDDANGYVDDISGWDFFHNDNDPADDTSFGHGTRSIVDAVGEANNGRRGAGVCPDCSAVMLRVGDAFVPEVNAWSMAVAYAVDLGASVVQLSGGGGLSNPSFSRDAIQYAYDNDVTIMASNSDLDSFHANFPNTNDHVVSVHAITYDATSLESATTFFNFAACTNYGAQLMISMPATGCSSEASARSGGLAGLYYSAALAAGLPAPRKSAGDPLANRRLTVEEVRQLLIGTVDSFYNPADATNPLKYPTRPGFARRFGYGRPNARKALDAIVDGRLPPEVDLRTPAWFDTLYADRTPILDVVGRVGLRGQVANPPGTTFDYVVEWAPGVDPDDSAFVTIGHGELLSSAVDGPLASWDVSQLTVDNPVPAPPAWQPDDPANVHLVTLRARAVVHSSNPMLDGQKGEARRAVHVFRDPNLLPGFPVFVGASGEASPKLADLDGDRRREIVYADTDGRVHAFRADGSELAGWPVHVERLELLDPQTHTGKGHSAAPSFSGALSPDRYAPIAASPAIADLDGDGRLEVVIATWNGYLWVFHADGSVAAGFPVELDRESAQLTVDSGHELEDGFWASPVLADLDKDGKLEIVQAAMDGKLYVWRSDGTRQAGFPVVVQEPRFSDDPAAMPRRQRERIMTTPAAGDLNGDGVPDLVLGSNENYADGGRLYVVDGRGAAAPGGPFLPGWPIAVVSATLLPVVAQGVPCTPALADVDGDRRPEVIVSGLASVLRVYSASGQPMGAPMAGRSDKYGARSPARNAVELMMLSYPAVGDLDDDGAVDVVEGGAGGDVALAFVGGGLRRDFEHHLGAWDARSGRFKPGFPQVVEDWQVFSTPALADIDGDGRINVIAGSAGYFIHAWDVDGKEPRGFPKFTGGWVLSTPAVGDLDGDGRLELVAGTRNGWLYAWRGGGRVDGRIDWASFHHDNRNTGNFLTALDQGRRAAPGGCAVAGVADGALAVAALLLCLGAHARRRRWRGSCDRS
jgi:hypothetical protein